ncbi:unnamed protein product, partial [Musa textilis]
MPYRHIVCWYEVVCTILLPACHAKRPKGVGKVNSQGCHGDHPRGGIMPSTPEGVSRRAPQVGVRPRG